MLRGKPENGHTGKRNRLVFNGNDMMAGFMLRLKALALLHPDGVMSSAMNRFLYQLGATENMD